MSIFATGLAIGVSKIVTKVSKGWVSVAVVMVTLAIYSPGLAYVCTGLKSVDDSPSPKFHSKLTIVSEVDKENSVLEPKQSLM